MCSQASAVLRIPHIYDVALEQRLSVLNERGYTQQARACAHMSVCATGSQQHTHSICASVCVYFQTVNPFDNCLANNMLHTLHTMLMIQLVVVHISAAITRSQTHSSQHNDNRIVWGCVWLGCAKFEPVVRASGHTHKSEEQQKDVRDKFSAVYSCRWLFCVHMHLPCSLYFIFFLRILTLSYAHDSGTEIFTKVH